MHNDSVIAPSVFQDFFDGWLLRQQRFLHELLSLQETTHGDDHLKEVFTRALAHYEQYYQEKSRIARQNVFIVFAPPWFTPLEQTFLWIAGFRPSLAYRVLHGSVFDLSDEQTDQLDRLKNETRLIEKVLRDEIARVQENVASPPLLEWAKQRAWSGMIIDGEIDRQDPAVERIRSEIEAVVGRADVLRMSTVMRVVEILTPKQNVKFLTAVTEKQVKLRNMGMRLM